MEPGNPVSNSKKGATAIANQLLTIAMITKEAMMLLTNKLLFVMHCDRTLSREFGRDGAKIGTTINVRRPPRYLGRTGQGLALEDAVETSVPLVLNTQFGVDLAFTSADLALSIDEFSNRFIRPNIAAVANKVDRDGLQQYLNVSNEVGAPGTVPNTLLTYLNAGALLDNEAVPRDDRRMVIMSPNMQAVIVDALKGLFQSSELIAEQYERGEMGKGAGFSWGMDQNVWQQTVGGQGGTPVVSGAGQTGSTISTSGWTANAAVLNVGDVVTFGGAFAVNPQNRQSFGTLRQFVVTQPVTANAGGVASISISANSGFGVIPSGQFQNVSASPTNGGPVTVSGTGGTASPRGLVFHEEAFACGFAELPLYEGVDKANRQTDEDTNISIRFIRAYDINMDRAPCRTDVLYGYLTKYPEAACRVAS